MRAIVIRQGATSQEQVYSCRVHVYDSLLLPFNSTPTVQLVSLVKPTYLPEADQATVLRLGIAPLAVADWLQIDTDFAAFHAHKQNVLTEFTDRVYQSLPESQAAQEQFARFLLQILREHHAADYSMDNSILTHRNTGLCWETGDQSLSQCSRWIQEDICLLEPKGADYILTAASVCSPSNWKLESKIGRTLDAIHAPVPGYEDILAARVNRLLAGIKPGKSLLRFNWSLQGGNELLWRQDYAANQSSSELYWRVERQSLLRIPGSAIIVFSIRIYLHSVQQLLVYPEFRNKLRAILARLPADQMTYKGLLDKILV